MHFRISERCFVMFSFIRVNLVDSRYDTKLTGQTVFHNSAFQDPILPNNKTSLNDLLNCTLKSCVFVAIIKVRSPLFIHTIRYGKKNTLIRETLRCLQKFKSLFCNELAEIHSRIMHLSRLVGLVF